MDKTVYKSAVSWWLWALVAIPVIITSVITVMDGDWTAILIHALVALFVGHLFFTTYYTVEGNTLNVKSSVLINIKIDITTIRKITETNNPLSSPALSLDRLWIDYGKNGAVMISPEDKEGFIRHILLINPSVEVKFRKK
jgi:hypothetical protein